MRVERIGKRTALIMALVLTFTLGAAYGSATCEQGHAAQNLYGDPQVEWCMAKYRRIEEFQLPAPPTKPLPTSTKKGR